MYTDCSQIDRESRAKGEWNDCTVRAIAVTTGINYDRVHDACRKRGRRKGRGMYDHQWKRVLSDLGFALIDRTDEVRRAGGKTTRTVVNVLPTRPHIIGSHRHVSGWNGTKLLDWADGRLKRVSRVYEVVRLAKGEAAPTTPLRPVRRRPVRRNIDFVINKALSEGGVKLDDVRDHYACDDATARSLLGRARTQLKKQGRTLTLIAPKHWLALYA